MWMSKVVLTSRSRGFSSGIIRSTNQFLAHYESVRFITAFTRVQQCKGSRYIQISDCENVTGSFQPLFIYHFTVWLHVTHTIQRPVIGQYWVTNQKQCGRKWSWNTLRHHPNICLEWLRKPTNELQSGYSVSRLRLELGTSWIQVKNVTDCSAV
jgi:hypothetical protein